MGAPGDPPGDPLPDNPKPSVVGFWRAEADGGLHEGGTVAYWRGLALALALVLLLVVLVAVAAALA